ncbi:minor capsid protein [Faecalicatena contorta]|nr:minor head protein [uncultured phage]
MCKTIKTKAAENPLFFCFVIKTGGAVINSQEYWRKREEENLKHNLKTEAEYLKTINSYYDYMMDQIQKEINGFYAKYAKKEGITLAEAKKRVLTADIEAYGRKAAKYVKEKDFSAEANAEMRLYNATMKINRLEMLKANIGLELVDGFNELQKYFDQILTDRTLKEFERQAGILGKTIQNNAKAAESIVNASFHNAKFSDRIWMYQDMMKAELSKLLQEGLIQGKNPRQLASHLQKLFGVSKSDAQRLMRTELARVQTDAQLRSLEENGFAQYEFIALRSACDICRAIDGKHFDINKARVGINVPPVHPNCRCSTAGYEDSEEYEEWIDFLDNGGTTKQWNRLKNKDRLVAKRSESRIIKASNTKEDADVSIIRYLGRIDTTSLEKEFGKIRTDEIIVTNERLSHIKERHPEDYDLFEKYGKDSVENPDFVIKDGKHDGTVFMVKKMQETNLNVVVRVVIETDKEGLKNSVMTFYRIRERNLRKLIDRNSLLYKKE